MELNWIEDFLALQRTQNFTEAATQRCSTQPAFSRRIQQLEEWLGTPLFDRTLRPVQLTIGGEEFLRRAQRLREDILDARRIAMSSQSHYRQAERIYATTAIAVGILPAWLKKTDSLNHSILTSSSGGCLEALLQKRADKIFLPWFEDENKDPQLHYQKIADDDLILVEATDATKRVSFKDKTLSGPLLIYAPGTIFGQQIANHLEKAGITCERSIACESSSAETLLALVKQGLGAAWIPESLTRDEGLKPCKTPKNLHIPCSVMMINRLD